ncbi:hypothetical protein [Planococcus halotolerans]|uniref:Uncharacterized protein n=1 Tax=Planococcus halotolerans TaxID=2233542 RepID=A0A365KQZ3_9BACL|nr:hypothetical protein [Planococcus halotolerans]QHJ69466.1 hypothetical protein DNR44_001945 [Planococcus halotolerans]RAZ75418.1 hypothetical protein DP120_13655 [Planococcus halotolerans]
MFGFRDLLSLIISAFIILPVVVFLREMGYVIVSMLLGVKNPRLTVGSGPRVVKIGMFDIRKYYHLYSWFSYDSLKREGKFAYIMLYAGPILMNVIVALVINAMLANDMLEEYRTFWNRFIFYAFYYVLFDVVPMKTANGMPNNGLIIYEMLRYGKRTDYNEEPFIPGTSDVEEQYQEEMEKIEEVKEHQKDMAEEHADNKKEEKQRKAEIEKDKQKEIEELEEAGEHEQAKKKKHDKNKPE